MFRFACVTLMVLAIASAALFHRTAQQIKNEVCVCSFVLLINIQYVAHIDPLFQITVERVASAQHMQEGGQQLQALREESIAATVICEAQAANAIIVLEDDLQRQVATLLEANAALVDKTKRQADR